MALGLSKRATMLNIHVRVNPKEAKEIDELAADRGLSFAAMVRYLVKQELNRIKAAAAQGMATD